LPYLLPTIAYMHIFLMLEAGTHSLKNIQWHLQNATSNLEASVIASSSDKNRSLKKLLYISSRNILTAEFT